MKTKRKPKTYTPPVPPEERRCYLCKSTLAQVEHFGQKPQRDGSMKLLPLCRDCWKEAGGK
jgi:hypothetical protein